MDQDRLCCGFQHMNLLRHETHISVPLSWPHSKSSMAITLLRVRDLPQACCSGNCDPRHTRCDDALNYSPLGDEKRTTEIGGSETKHNAENGYYAQIEDSRYDGVEHDDWRYDDGQYEDSHYDHGGHDDVVRHDNIGQHNQDDQNGHHTQYDDQDHHIDVSQYADADGDPEPTSDAATPSRAGDNPAARREVETPAPGPFHDRGHDPTASPSAFDSSGLAEDFDGPPMKIDPDGPYAHGTSYSSYDDDRYDGYNRGAEEDHGERIGWEARVRSRGPTSRNQPSGSSTPPPSPLSPIPDAGADEGIDEEPREDGGFSGDASWDGCVANYSSGTIETIASASEERIETVAMDSQVSFSVDSRVCCRGPAGILEAGFKVTMPQGDVSDMKRSSGNANHS